MTTEQMKRAIYEIARDRCIDWRDGIWLNRCKVCAVERRPKDRDLWFLTTESDGYHVCRTLCYLTDSETEYVYNKLTKGN